MDSFGLEVTACRIGGRDDGERTWGPRVQQIDPNGMTHVDLHGFHSAAYGLYLRFGNWHIVRPGLLSTDLMITDTNGYHIGPPRPVLLSTLPSDVPLYSSHIASNPDVGLFTIGLRIPRYHWMPADLVTAAEAVSDGE
jgi:hypothetical protein